jgi:hypothetical protein
MATRNGTAALTAMVGVVGAPSELGSDDCRCGVVMEVGDGGGDKERELSRGDGQVLVRARQVTRMLGSFKLRPVMPDSE